MTLYIPLIYPYFPLLVIPPYICHTQLLVKLIKLNDWFCANRLSLDLKRQSMRRSAHLLKYQKLPQNTAITLNGINLIRVGIGQPEMPITFLWHLYGSKLNMEIAHKYAKI